MLSKRNGTYIVSKKEGGQVRQSRYSATGASAVERERNAAGGHQKDGAVAPPSTFFTLFTLQQAQRMLGIEFKTLKRRMKVLGIEGIEDELDRRRRLLTLDDVNRLRDTFEALTLDVDSESPLSLRKLGTRVAQLMRWRSDVNKTLDGHTAMLAAQNDAIRQLQKQLGIYPQGG